MKNNRIVAPEPEKAPETGGPGQKEAAGRQRALEVLRLLKLRYPAPATHLAAENPWELLVATVLAAQCTDARVNKVTPALFARWPGPAELAGADPKEVEEYVRSTGFYHNKAKNLIGAAKLLCQFHNGLVPDNMKALLALPGVARKTANVVLFGAYGINEGFAVDTHVGRIAWRLGFASGHDPLKTERELTALFPREEWGDLNHRLVWFGREICKARAPRCAECELARLCEKRGI